LQTLSEKSAPTRTRFEKSTPENSPFLNESGLHCPEYLEAYQKVVLKK